MPIFHAFVLGLVQGLSEFLPISSSGHLLLVPWLFGWNDFDDKSVEKAFDVALHLGTLIAAIVYLRHEVARLPAGRGAGDRAPRAPARRPTAGSPGCSCWRPSRRRRVGAVFQDSIDEHLGTPTIIAISLDRVRPSSSAWPTALPARRDLDDLRTRDAVVVGAAQALSLNPGTSRSGITITGARAGAASTATPPLALSFLMMIPVTAGAFVFKMAGLAADGIPDGLAVPMLVGIVTSGVSGWFAIWGLLRIVRTHSFMPFVVYRIVVGVVVLLIVATGWR